MITELLLAMCQKVKVSPFWDDSPQCLYLRLLTSYAAEFVKKQLKLAEKVDDFSVNDGVYTVKTSEGMKIVSLTSCECIFF